MRGAPAASTPPAAHPIPRPQHFLYNEGLIIDSDAYDSF